MGKGRSWLEFAANNVRICFKQKGEDLFEIVVLTFLRYWLKMYVFGDIFMHFIGLTCHASTV